MTVALSGRVEVNDDHAKDNVNRLDKSMESFSRWEETDIFDETRTVLC